MVADLVHRMGLDVGFFRTRSSVSALRRKHYRPTFIGGLTQQKHPLIFRCVKRTMVL